MEKQIRCVIYTRKSCEEGLDLEYNSLDNQRDSCINYINSQKFNNWIYIDKEYNDGGYSGGTLERPAMRQLIEDIKNNKIDIIVVYKIDRLSRSLMDFAKLNDLFIKHSVSFVSVTQNFDTSNSMGKLMLNILLSFAQFEREMDSDRIKDKLLAQKKKGMWTGGNVPLGYDILDKKLIINEKESKIINFIFDTFIGTKSITNTLIVLQNSNITSKQSRKFTKKMLYNILSNKIYLGFIEMKKYKEFYKGQHNPIITQEQYDTVNNIIESRNLKKLIGKDDIDKNSKMPYLLKGLLKCEYCNSILTPTYTKKKNNIIYRYYKCNKSMKEVNHNNCKLPTIPAEKIEQIILNEVYNILKSPEIIANVIKKRNNTIKEQNIITSFNNIEVIWNELFPKEQLEIINNIIEQITVNEEELKIRFKINGFINLLKETNINITTTDDKTIIEKIIKINFLKISNKVYIKIPYNTNYKEIEAKHLTNNEDDDKTKQILINNLIQAINWQEQIINKKETINSIATKEQKQNSYICRIYSLNYLSPDIKKNILQKNIPLNFSMEQFKRKPIPLSWKEQREIYGFKEYS